MATPPIKYVARLLDFLNSGGVAAVGVAATGLVSPDTLQAAADPLIAAFDDSDPAQESFDNLAARETAEADIDDNKDSIHKLLRASASVLLDEFNLHADKFNAILTAIDSGATLAAVKANIAAIPDYPQRTFAQVVTAIKNKVNSGTVD